jgi:hypothetical protein
MTRIVLAALAVAGTTAAMAQSSVTRYGRVNTTVERQKAGDVSNTGLFNANNGRWMAGFRLNLSGGLGMLRLGNFTPESYYATADHVGLHSHDRGSSSDAL